MGFMNDGNPMPVFVHFRLTQKWFNPMNAWFIFGLILTCFMKPILSASLSLSFCQQYLPLFLILYLYLFGSFSISLFLSLTLYPLLYTPLSLPFFLSDSLFLSLFGSFSLCHLSLSFCLLLCIPCFLSISVCLFLSPSLSFFLAFSLSPSLFPFSFFLLVTLSLSLTKYWLQSQSLPTPSSTMLKSKLTRVHGSIPVRYSNWHLSQPIPHTDRPFVRTHLPTYLPTRHPMFE